MSHTNKRIVDELASRVASGWALLNRTCPTEKCLTTLVRNRSGQTYCVSCQLWCIQESDLTHKGSVPNTFTKGLDIETTSTKSASNHMMDDFMDDYSMINSKRESPRSSRLSGVSDKLGAKMLAGWTMLGAHCPGPDCTCPLMRDRSGVMLCVQCDRNVVQVGDAYQVVNPSSTAPPLTSPIRIMTSPSTSAPGASVPPSPAGAGRLAPPSTPVHGTAPSRPRVSFSQAMSRLTGHAEEEDEDMEDRALREREKQLERDPDTDDEEEYRGTRGSRTRSDSELEREIAEFEAQEPDHAALAAIDARMTRVNKTSALLGQKMLAGYTLLGVHCPDCHCPLVRKVDGPMECVSCDATVVRETDIPPTKPTPTTTSTTTTSASTTTPAITITPAKRPSEGIKEEPHEKKLRPRASLSFSREQSIDDMSSQLLSTPQSRAVRGAPSTQDPSPLSTPPTTPQPISTFSYARPSFSFSRSHDHGPVPFTPVLRAAVESPLIQHTTQPSQTARPILQPQSHMQIEPTAVNTHPTTSFQPVSIISSGSNMDSSLSHVMNSTIVVLTMKLAQARDMLSEATTGQQILQLTAIIRDLVDTLRNMHI